MYTEETKTTINWSSVIKKGIVILLVALVIFFIIWLFARNNEPKVNVNYDNGNNTTTTPSVTPNNKAYSKEYLEGYRYFHDTVKEYFLISELPSEGQSKKYTLQELIDKNLIFAWEYKNGEPCDTEASYAYVTNENGKYKLTITLVCGVEVAKTTEELGCNQLCTNGSCLPSVPEDEYITEYQYKQAYTDYETTYSCPSGYTKNGTKCVKNNKTTVAATKNVTYSCPSGYTATGSGASMKCYKNTNDVKDATIESVYSCPSGYNKSGSGANTKCYKTSSNYTSAKYNTVYSCDSGYAMVGTGVNAKCVKEDSSSETIKATANTTYKCSDSTYSLRGTQCVKNDTKPAIESTTYDCSKVGGTLVNEKYCRVYSTKSSYESYETYKGTSYNGCSYSGSYTDVCSAYKGCTRTYYKYYCSKSSYKDVAATANTTYKCSDSTYSLNGTQCTKNDTKPATPTTTYSCPSGYSKSGSGANTVCTKNNNSTSYGTLRTEKRYYCDKANEYLVGDKCYLNSEETINPNITNQYSCPVGYTKNGTKCTYTLREDRNAIKNTTYSCDKGYTKYGVGSDSVCTKGTTTSIDATKSTKKVTKYRYQWSSSETLEGWERTGETRQSKVVNNNTDNNISEK